MYNDSGMRSMTGVMLFLNSRLKLPSFLSSCFLSLITLHHRLVSMREILYVACGGALGAASRFILTSCLAPVAYVAGIPIAIFTVNVLGCFAAGVLLAISERANWFTGDIHRFLFPGVLGGFTTFSAFGIEALTLVRTQQIGTTIFYISLSVMCSLAAVWCGYTLFKN